jgi:hypothetical protein
MSFHLCRSKPPFKPRILLRNTEVKYKPEVKFLGMHITENLSWHAHICSLCHSLSGTFFIIKSVKSTLSSQALWNIYTKHMLSFSVLFDKTMCFDQEN